MVRVEIMVGGEVMFSGRIIVGGEVMVGEKKNSWGRNKSPVVKI